MNPATNPVLDTHIDCSVSDTFVAWMSQAGGSLAVTTYQAGKLALIGWDGRQVTLLMRQFQKPMGLAVEGARLALATRHAVWLFANAPVLAHGYLEDQPGRYDALFLPRVAYYTGDLNVHDVAFGADGLVLVNSRFGCLASLSDQYSFVPGWRPPFVTEVVPEDRCHLNGLALVDGRPKFVTVLGETNEPGGWRAQKATGGAIVDVESNQIVLRGLSMPHSPRWHDGRLWVLNSGAGEIGQVDPVQGKYQVLRALPGYLRGLCFVGRHAVIGLSRIREKHIFGGLPVQQRFDKLLCGLAVVDLLSGQHIGTMEFTAGCHEIYDVRFLPGIHRPNILNLDKPAVFDAFPAPDFNYWLRPSAEVKG